MKWKSTALGEVMRHRKGSITIDDTTSYKLCRVQLHRRGVVLRQNLNGAAISTKKQQVCKAGDFLVAEMDAKVGGYGFVPAELDGAIVSSHYYLFEVDAEKLHPEYLEVVSQAEILQQQIVANLRRSENLGVRQVNARRIAWRVVGVEGERVAGLDPGFLVLEGADADMRMAEAYQHRRARRRRLVIAP